MRSRTGFCFSSLVAFSTVLAPAASLPRFDFTRPETVAEWERTHDIARIEAVADGMRISISGADPYSCGPARDYPAGQPLFLCLRLNSDMPGMLQVFYFTDQAPPSEEVSVRTFVRGSRWETVRVAMPPLAPRSRLRINPPGIAGACTISALWFEDRSLLREPEWPKPVPPIIGRDALPMRSGMLELIHAPNQIGAFSIKVGGQPMAVGHTRAMIGYQDISGLRWVNLENVRADVSAERGGIVARAKCSDPDEGIWHIEQRFTASKTPDVIEVQCRVSVDRDRTVVYLPMLTLLPGLGSFGKARGQALMPGLEYLDAPDISSSEADIIGPLSHRQVPDTMRLCFPLLAIHSTNRSIGLCWQPDGAFCPVFDTPDRLFASGAHLMGVLYPGSDGQNRLEGSLLPYKGEILSAHHPLVLRAAILGGSGPDILPIVQRYVAYRGLPPLPQTRNLSTYAGLATSGWLDSRLSEAGRFRHAYWPGMTSFAPQPAADAVMYMDWLALHVASSGVKMRLEERATAALGNVAAPQLNSSGVSHVRYPVECLLYGHVAENVAQARVSARAALARFEADGTISYPRNPSGLDYGKTHFEHHANGLTAPVVLSVLEGAVFSGDPELIRAGLRQLSALHRYDHAVPRGAQTWEVPLHTPDILAAAYLVRAYTLGYEITGDDSLLVRARDWAWSGLPFVYLVNPTGQEMGPYAGTAVFGATQWVAPDWMGQPVQWCALVYADALYRLVRHDPGGPWLQVARGLTASGIQQTFPRSEPDLGGLLPDSINLRPQTRNGAAINPGTLQANAVRFYTGSGLYDFRAFRQAGLYVHVPGTITSSRDAAESAVFVVKAWPAKPYYVLVSGLKSMPRVRINGRSVAGPDAPEWRPEGGILILRVQGNPRIELRLSPS